jgi:hypothetical protein
VSADAAGTKSAQGGGPGRLRAGLLKLLLIVAGYVLAVAVATLVTVALLFAPAALSNGMLAGVRFAVTDAPVLVFVGFFWTFFCALPGFVFVILLGERLGWRRWHGYAFAGLADVVPSFLVFSIYAGSLLGMADLFLSALPGGFAGGAAYWAGTGRFVAARRR